MLGGRVGRQVRYDVVCSRATTSFDPLAGGALWLTAIFLSGAAALERRARVHHQPARPYRRPGIFGFDFFSFFSFIATVPFCSCHRERHRFFLLLFACVGLSPVRKMNTRESPSMRPP
ncbi:hypothetical protein [Pandoravirus japonicus]|uniref:Uncharacterized protein n=1 Tax=Pandoravirus japonicus TaxID=2823154 RepID=A0A811BQB5_9VIRU|nr:hypothetical protein [Pandoravirus japonicus]